MSNKKQAQKGGDRRFRRDLIAFYDDEEIIPYDINSSSPEQINKLRYVLENSFIGGIRLCFRDPEANKQTRPLNKERFYLKVKRMSIKYTDKDIYAGIWRKTGLNTPPRDHYFVYFLLCVKGIHVEGDLEFPLLSVGVAIEDSGNVARVSIPDRVFTVFDYYQTGELGDWSINSEKTLNLEMSESTKLIDLAQLLHYHSKNLNLNGDEEVGHTLFKSNDFAKELYSLFADYKKLSLEESLRRMNSKLGRLLLQEHMYFKDNKPPVYTQALVKAPVKKEESKMPTIVKVDDELDETPSDEFYSPSSSPTSSPRSSPRSSPTSSPRSSLSPLSQTSSRTEVGLPLDESDAITIERCLRNNPCLKLIYDELKGNSDESTTSDRGAIRKKRKKSSKKKKKKKRTKKKSSKKRRKKTKKRTKKRTKKKK